MIESRPESGRVRHPSTPFKLLFLRYGSFSHTNQSLISEFRRTGFLVLDYDLSSVINPRKTFLGKLYAAMAAARYGRNWREGVNYFPQVFKSMSRYCNDIVDRENPDAIFQTQTLFSAGAGEVRKPYFIYTDHTHMLTLRAAKNGLGDVVAKGSPRWLELEKECYDKATRIFVMSNYIGNSMAQDYKISADRISTVYPGTNVPAARENRTYYDGKTILFVGVDFERKGGRSLLEAFSSVKKIVPDARLVIVGCQIENTDPSIVVKGRLSLELTAKEFREASIFVMPSLREPFGLVFVEAMTNGLPCIGTRVESIPELIDDGETGFLVDVSSPEQLADRIVRLLTNIEEVRRMGENAFRKSKWFLWPNSVRQMADIIMRESVREKTDAA